MNQQQLVANYPIPNGSEQQMFVRAGVERQLYQEETERVIIIDKAAIAAHNALDGHQKQATISSHANINLENERAVKAQINANRYGSVASMSYVGERPMPVAPIPVGPAERMRIAEATGMNHNFDLKNQNFDGTGGWVDVAQEEFERPEPLIPGFVPTETNNVAYDDGSRDIEDDVLILPDDFYSSAAAPVESEAPVYSAPAYDAAPAYAEAAPVYQAETIAAEQPMSEEKLAQQQQISQAQLSVEQALLGLAA